MGRRRQCDSPATLIQMGMHRPHRPWGTGATLRAGPNSRESATSREHEPPQIQIKYKRLDVTRKRLQTEPASSKPVVGVRIADAPIGTRYDGSRAASGRRRERSSLRASGPRGGINTADSAVTGAKVGTVFLSVSVTVRVTVV